MTSRSLKEVITLVDIGKTLTNRGHLDIPTWDGPRNW